MTWMRQRSSGKIDFTRVPDGELNLIAAALMFKDNEQPRASRSPSRARNWSIWGTHKPRGRSASKRRSQEDTCVTGRRRPGAEAREEGSKGLL